MSYCSPTEVQSDFKSIDFTVSGANVTTASVTQFIAEADALINSYVGKVYVTPVAQAGDGLTLLKLLSRSLTAGRIKRLMTVKVDKSTDANQDILGVLLSPTAVMKILTDIQTQQIALAGAQLLNAGGGFYSNNVSNAVAPVVTKDDKQW